MDIFHSQQPKSCAFLTLSELNSGEREIREMMKIPDLAMAFDKAGSYGYDRVINAFQGSPMAQDPKSKQLVIDALLSQLAQDLESGLFLGKIYRSRGPDEPYERSLGLLVQFTGLLELRLHPDIAARINVILAKGVDRALIHLVFNEVPDVRRNEGTWPGEVIERIRTCLLKQKIELTADQVTDFLNLNNIIYTILQGNPLIKQLDLQRPLLGFSTQEATLVIPLPEK